MDPPEMFQTRYLTSEEEALITYGVCSQIMYDRRQAACMIDALIEQLHNCHLPMDYRSTLSRRIRAARRRWFDEWYMNLEFHDLRDILRLACRIHDWSADLGNLFETNARMIRHRMGRIRDINFNRRQLGLCL